MQLVIYERMSRSWHHELSYHFVLEIPKREDNDKSFEGYMLPAFIGGRNFLPASSIGLNGLMR